MKYDEERKMKWSNEEENEEEKVNSNAIYRRISENEMRKKWRERLWKYKYLKWINENLKMKWWIQWNLLRDEIMNEIIMKWRWK